MSKTAADYVASGVALLDEKKPGWEWSRGFDNLGTLNIASVDDCTLGKAYASEAVGDMSGYEAGKIHLGLKGLSLKGGTSDYGFAATFFCGREKSDNVSHDELTREWRRVIVAKRAKFLSDLADLSDGVADGVRVDNAQELAVA